ncbi:MAG: VWA domain-containing protein [Roseiflexaceae bacterium]
MTLLYPWVLGVGGLFLGLMVLWHILRPKSQMRMIPSLQLWRDLMPESQAYRPIHPPQPWWVLLMRMLIVAVLTLAAAGPIVVADSTPKHLIIVVDTSASMAARVDAVQRIDEAKRIAQTLVAGAPVGSDVTLMRVDTDVEVIASREPDRTRLNQQIELLTARPVAGNLDLLSQWLVALEGRNSQIYVISDDVRLAQFDWPPLWQRIGIGGVVRNDAIDDVLVTQQPDGWNVRVRVRRYGPTATTSRVVEVRDAQGELVGANQVQFDSDNQFVWAFDLAEPVQTLQFRLAPDDTDGLASDDVVFWYREDAQPIRVALQSDDQRFVPAALSILPNIQLVTDTQQADLLILSGQTLPTTPTAPMWLIDMQVDNPNRVNRPVIQRLSLSGAESRINRDIDVTATQILTATVLDVPLWGQRWLSSDSGTHAYLGTYNGYPTIVFGFDVRQSDLVLRPEFPLVVRNIIEYLTPVTRQSRWQTGESIVLGPSDTPPQLLSAPTGSTARIEQVGSQYYLLDAITPGLYNLSTRTLVVNLQSRVESDIVRIDESPTIDIARTTIGGFTLTQGFVLLALLLLAGERWLALIQRRVT